MVGDDIQNEYDNKIVDIDQDNEFELVFVIAYQKMLNLHYLDKLLDEIQLRWAKQFHSRVYYKRIIYLLRFRDMFQDNLQAGKFLEDFSGFGPEFTRALKLVEEESRIEKLAQQKPRKFEESEKSQKSIKSMIVSDKNDLKTDVKSAHRKRVPAGLR